jgi:hypothetical protein
VTRIGDERRSPTCPRPGLYFDGIVEKEAVMMGKANRTTERPRTLRVRLAGMVGVVVAMNC